MLFCFVVFVESKYFNYIFICYILCINQWEFLSWLVIIRYKEKSFNFVLRSFFVFNKNYFIQLYLISFRNYDYGNFFLGRDFEIYILMILYGLNYNN